MRSVPRGETRSLDTLTVSSAAPVEPTELSTYLWDRLRDKTVVLASGVPVITTSRKSITWPKLIEDAEAAFYDELEEIDEINPGFDEFEVDPKAIKALVRGSSEAFEDSDPDLLEIVRSNLETILGLKLDRELLVGNDAKGFPGMTNADGITVMDAEGSMSNYDLILRAIGALRGNHVAGPVAVIAHPYTETHVSLFKTLTTGETLPRPEGVPSFSTTTQVGRDAGEETSTVLVYVPSLLRVVRRRDVTIEVDRSQEFTKDAVFVRGKLRATLFLPYPQAVVKIVNVPAPDPVES
jgi:HK97 family phage major capsid protein